MYAYTLAIHKFTSGSYLTPSNFPKETGIVANGSLRQHPYKWLLIPPVSWKTLIAKLNLDAEKINFPTQQLFTSPHSCQNPTQQRKKPSPS